MDNSGRGPLKVPGFGGIPIHYELACESRFAHGISEWHQLPAITAREFAMVAAMNDITDKPDWHIDVFDPTTVTTWRSEAFGCGELMSEQAWEWCIKELRDKARSFERDGHVRVLDTGSCVCKADLPPASLGDSLRLEASHLPEQNRSGDGQESCLVDPYLFPLVYGRSLVLQDGGCVDLQAALNAYGRAQRAPDHFDRRLDSAQLQAKLDRRTSDFGGVTPDHEFSTRECYYWSSNYQALPCEVEFAQASGTDVRITSYINNLHPSHKELYHCIEKLIGSAIKLWDDCLIRGKAGWEDDNNQGQRGPVPARIVTYGIEWDNELPAWADAFQIPREWMIRRYHDAKAVMATPEAQEFERGGTPTMAPGTKVNWRRKLALRDKISSAKWHLKNFRNHEHKLTAKLPPPDSDLWLKAKEYLALPEPRSEEPLEVPDNIGDEAMWGWILQKHKRLLFHRHPEPGTAFSYEDWQAGRNTSKAVVEIINNKDFWRMGDYDPPWEPYTPNHTRYKVCLEDEFRQEGLQVIVQMDEVSLAAGTQQPYVGTWRLDGHKNEHIVAMAVLAYELDNITDARISFRQETPMWEGYYDYNESRRRGDTAYINHHRNIGKYHEYSIIAEIFGFKEGKNLLGDFPDIMPYQELGGVALRQDRLVAFPSPVEYRLDGLALVDGTRPGRLRTVKLMLVDPHYRVCSTRNVPPQQHEWWAAAAAEQLPAEVPAEVRADIMAETGEWPMGEAEAATHRANMIKELRWKDMVRYGKMQLYGFEI